MIAIVNSGVANIASVCFALDRLQVDYCVTTDSEVIKQACGVILPGVGSARAAMSNLSKLGLVEVLQQLTQPVLGICLGMQLLYQSSEEGSVACLGVLPGKIEKMRCAELVLPHMGWNRFQVTDNPLLQGVSSRDYVYFVHSFSKAVDENTIAIAEYGAAFTAMCQRDNFFGAQFHPERSGAVGAKILNNFVRLTCK